MPRRGFTLIEITIVCAIVVLLAAFSFPFFNLFQGFSATEAITFEIKESLRTAEIKARSGQDNSNFGVYFSTGQYILYQGPNYASRNTSADQTFTLPGNITVSGAAEVNFTHSTGRPNTAATIIITNIDTQNQTNLNVNSIGLIY